MRTPIAIAIAALALPAAAHAHHQATFDMTAKGRWASTVTQQFEPTGDCPLYRGAKTERQVLTLRYRGRVVIQHQDARQDRWYVTPVGRSTMTGTARLAHERTDTTEMQYCNQTVWEPSDIRDRPRDSSCSRRQLLNVGIFKGGFRFNPATGGIGGRCVFDAGVEPYPQATQNLRLVDRATIRKLNRGRIVNLTASARKEDSDREQQSTTTRLREGGWTVKLKRRGGWRPWNG